MLVLLMSLLVKVDYTSFVNNIYVCVYIYIYIYIYIYTVGIYI